MSLPASRVRATLGAALFAALVSVVVPGASPRAVDDDPLVATINGQPLRLSYVYRQIEALPLGEQIAIRQQLERFAESLVREEILFQSVIASGFESEPQLREAVKASVVQHLIQRHVKDRIRVTDAQVRAFYQANTSAIRGEEVRASQILLATRAECEALAASIDSGARFRSVARERSLHRPSADRGGDLGLFMNHAGPFGFETELFDMQPGQMRVFESGQGCHLVRVTERATPPLPPLSEVTPRIRQLLEARQERELLEALLDKAARGVTVERASWAP